MNSRQSRIWQVLSSTAVGTIAFCLTLPLVLIMGAVLLSPFLPPGSTTFFPPELGILFLISVVVGLIAAIFVVRKYCLYLAMNDK